MAAAKDSALIHAAARSTLVPTAKDRAERRKRHAAEVKASQDALRKSIDETDRLVEQSEAMLRRHRKEHEDGDAAALAAGKTRR